MPHADDHWETHAKCSQTEVIQANLHHVLPRDGEPANGLTELFYPPRDRALYKPVADAAKAICRGKDGKPACPVRNECLRDAIDRDELFGIFGGMSHRERNALVRKLGKARMPLSAFLETGGPS